MTKKKEKILLDVREPSEFENQYIKGSHNIPLSKLPKHTKELSKINKDITLICRTGSRAQTACKLLKKEGAKNVDIMSGGIVAYDGQGNRLVMGTQKWDIERQVRLIVGFLVFVGAMLGHFVSPYFFLLPGAVGLGLMLASITNTCTMGMMLMRLPYNKPSKKPDTKKLIKKLQSNH